MKLKVLESSAKKVVAVTENNGKTCPVIDFLASQPKDRQGSARGFKIFFERYAQGGRNMLTAALFHEVDKDEKIWQFTKGKLRVFCYIDNDGKLLLLTHGALKKSQKVDPREVRRAIAIKHRYLEAKEDSDIIWENIDEY